jgi:hypothetical protein
MDPSVAGLALNLAMLFVLLSLVAAILADHSSFEFTLAVASFLISGAFLAWVSYDIRKEAKMATK